MPITAPAPWKNNTLEFYDGPQLFYRAPKADGAWVEIPFDIKKKEPLRLLLI